jgi:hypothetical protein
VPVSDEAWDALKATPIAEVRRRAAIIGYAGYFMPEVVDGAERFVWKDYDGQYTVWYFAPDGHVLLLTFEKYSELHLSFEHYAEQLSLYDDVPESLVRLARNRPEHPAAMNHFNAETGETINSACGVFWFDGQQWRAATGFVDHCLQRDLDPEVESGIGYCLEVYRFGQEFITTPESILEERATARWSDADREAELREAREFFARYS